MSTKLRPDELKQVQVERCVESIFSDNECQPTEEGCDSQRSKRTI